MGFLDNLTEKQNKKSRTELERFILDGEQIEFFFAVKEDFGAITDKRLVFLDKSLFGNKRSIIGIPFSKISAVGVKRGGAFSPSKEILVTVGSHIIEIDTFDENQAIEIYKQISARIL